MARDYPEKKTRELTAPEKRLIRAALREGATSRAIRDKVGCSLSQIAAIKANMTMGK